MVVGAGGPGGGTGDGGTSSVYGNTSAGTIPLMLDEAVRKKVKEIGYEQDGFHWKD